MSIRTKMLLPMIGLSLVSILAVLVIIIFAFSSYVDDSLRTEIEIFGDVLQEQIDNLETRAGVGALGFAADADLGRAIAEGDRKAILTEVDRLMSESDINYTTITDARGTVLLRHHDPDNYGDQIDGQSVVSAGMQGKTHTTVETGSAVRLAIRSGAPVYYGGELVGVVSAGFRLDTMDFVDEMKVLLGSEVTIFLGDERLSTTVTSTDGARAIGTKAAENVSEQVLTQGLPYAGTAQILGREAFVKYLPLRSSDGDIVGMIFTGKYMDVKNGAVRDFVLRGVLVAVLLLGVGALVGSYISRRIVRPIHLLIGAADKLADGDVDVDVQVDTKDETKQLADAFQRIIQANREQARTITAIAGGDLSLDIATRSDRDVVGRSLESMVVTNNRVYKNIIGVAEQVHTGASQVSQGAQQLAQNNTEQAASVEQLSQSIADIADKAHQSAEMAGKAAELGNSIRAKAEQGNAQMERMMEAVHEISSASQDIGKVIKVIDDIAFQTNILALNAAVEAARAGQHGKGFAVVADQVRNLAAKSAEAAKDSGVLIENSIEKAELGAAIAGDTAQSLIEIVDGIKESTLIVDEISVYSGQQTDAIDSINQSVGQVSQVVQSSSALAEQTAASSEEMSSQASLLTNLVGQFKLRDDARQQTAEAQRKNRGQSPKSAIALRPDTPAKISGY